MTTGGTSRRRITRTLTVLGVVLLVGAPMLAAAALNIWNSPNPLSCAAGDSPSGSCSLCDAVKLIANIADLLFNLVTPLAVLMIVYGGGLIMFAGGAEKNVQTGKKAITSALIGIAIAFFAWTIVGTFLQAIVDPTQILQWWPPTHVQC